MLADLAARDPHVRVMRYSRNVGYQRSIYAAYMTARGDVAVQLDCDLQDPPELIVNFMELWGDGYDIVYGLRRARQEGVILANTRRAFYRILDALAEDELPGDAGDFRLVSRRVLDVMRHVDDYHPYLRGLIATLGFRQVGVPYDRDARTAGESKFSLRALISLAFDGVLAHSIVPLRIATMVSFVMVLITMLGIITYAGGRFFFGSDWPAGFATTTVLLLLSITLNAFFLGIIGEYLGRIYQQVKRRPIAIVESRIEPRAAPGSPGALPGPPGAAL